MQRDYTIIYDKSSCVLNKDLSISTNDMGTDICFNVIDSPYVSLSKNKDLFAMIIIKSPLGKQIESDLTPIVCGKVIFTLTKKIMDCITESGTYKLYIVIFDDKNNKNVLPYMNMTVTNDIINIPNLSLSMVNSSPINNSLTGRIGNEINTYNIDGSYNRTFWKAGDIISDAKLNKIESHASHTTDCVVELERKVQELDDANSILILNGKSSDEPVVLAELDKGMHIISGHVADFATQNSFLLSGTNYFFVTGTHEDYRIISRCLQGDKIFKTYKYNKVLETVYLYDCDLKEVMVSGNYANVTDDKNQILNINTPCTILLPSVEECTTLTLFINITSEVSVSFPKMKWSTYPNLKMGTLSRVDLIFINDTWYGNSVSY